jgi:NitT/TauT family transport system permease protein
VTERHPESYTGAEPPRGEVPAASRMRRFLIRMLRLVLPGAVALVVFGLLWQLVASRNSYAFPSLGAIGQNLGGNLSLYGRDAAQTLEEVAVGLGVSFVVAFTLAVVMIHIPVIERAVMPLAVILNVTPIVAIAPGLTLILGVTTTPRYVVTALIVFFPLLINCLIGLRSADPEALDLLHTLHASKLEALLRLRIPSSLPFLFVAARICFPLATIGAVVAEFSTSGSSSGLGSQIASAASGLSTTGNALASVYACIFCLAVMGLGLTLIVTVAERRLLSWHPASARRGRSGAPAWF